MTDNIDTSLLDKQIDKAVSAKLANKSNGGDNGGMHIRLGKLEGVVEQLNIRLGTLQTQTQDHKRATDRDFRILFGALITLALGLSGLMAKGFGWF